jgi:DNA-binding NtrC family response regulator
VGGDDSRRRYRTAGDPRGTTVLVVDNNKVTGDSCERILRPEGYRVTAAPDADAALAAIASSAPDVILLDLYLPDTDGLTLIPKIRALAPRTAIVLITGYPTIDAAVEAMRRGAADFLSKPFSAGQLRNVVESVLRRLAGATD